VTKACRTAIDAASMSFSQIFASRRFAWALFFAVPAFFAANMLVARWNAGEIPPVALAFWRWTATLGMLLPFVAHRLWRGREELYARWKSYLWLGFLGMGVCGAPVYMAGVTTTATNIGLIYAASPVVIVLLAWLRYGDAVAGRQLLGVALCLCGTLWIVGRGDLGSFVRLEFVAGDLLVVVAMLAWSVYSVLLKHTPTKFDATARLAAIVAGGVAINLPFYAAETLYIAAPALDAKTLATILFTALVPGVGSYLSYSIIVARLGPALASLVMYLIPLYGALLAWLVLDERLAAFHLMGLALMLPGLWLGTRRAG
jgi:drug/metabolite transporter (DMT)-like permease